MKLVSTVAAPCDAALLELHDVLRQSARLVGEDVLDLTQLLVQGRSPSLRRVNGNKVSKGSFIWFGCNQVVGYNEPSPACLSLDKTSAGPS